MDPRKDSTAYSQQPTEIVVDDGTNGQRVITLGQRDDRGGGIRVPVAAGPNQVVQMTAPVSQQVRYSSLVSGAANS